ncbi:MAG: hypothetical protein AAFX99_23670 [Myxococcota bacterium]
MEFMVNGGRASTGTMILGMMAIALGCGHAPDGGSDDPTNPGYASVQPELPDLACRVGVNDAGVLMVDGHTLAELTVPSDGNASPNIAVWPWTAQSVLVAVRPDWERSGWPALDGRLWEIACGTSTPQQKIFFEEQGADLGHAALSPDGRVLYYSGAHGVKALMLATGEQRQLTHTPPVDARSCRETLGDDARQRDVVLDLSKDGRALRFVRGAPCGYGGDWLAQPWILMHPDDPMQAHVRAPWSVASVAIDGAGALWVADGGACDEPGRYDHQTIGAVWRSFDQGVSWSRVAVDVGYGSEEMVTAARSVLVASTPGHVAVLSQLCTSSATTIGGSIFVTRDHGDTWEPLTLVGAPARDDTTLGQGIEAMVLVDGTLDQIDVWIEGERLRVKTDDGKVTRLDNKAEPPTLVTSVRAGELVFEATDEGLFRRPADGSAAALRVFPSP